MKTTNVLLAIIAAALVAPQLPALRKAIHNNTVYRVQTALYERAVEEHKEVLKTWCKDNSSGWVQFTSDRKWERVQYFENNEAPVRSEYPFNIWGDMDYARDLDRYKGMAALGRCSAGGTLRRSHRRRTSSGPGGVPRRRTRIIDSNNPCARPSQCLDDLLGPRSHELGKGMH